MIHENGTISMRRTIFDLDVLRTFATGMELGNFARAADRLGRSTSAVSAQLKKLEEQAGTPIFRKAGRGLALTDAGETMLAYARRLLELNDEAAAAGTEHRARGLGAARIAGGFWRDTCCPTCSAVLLVRIRRSASRRGSCAMSS